MTTYTDNRLLAAGLVGGTLSRHHGNMRDITVQNGVYTQLDIPPQKILHFHQTHSDTIVPILSDDDAAPPAVSECKRAAVFVK